VKAARATTGRNHASASSRPDIQHLQAINLYGKILRRIRFRGAQNAAPSPADTHKEAQAFEPDGLVLRAIVGEIFAVGTPSFEHIIFSAITESIWRNDKVLSAAPPGWRVGGMGMRAETFELKS